jgi:hypothetical protein
VTGRRVCSRSRTDVIQSVDGLRPTGFGAGRQIELMDPGGVWFCLQRLFACAWGVGSGTSRDRSSAAFGPGNHTLSSRRETYSEKVILAMQYIEVKQIKTGEGRILCLLRLESFPNFLCRLPAWGSIAPLLEKPKNRRVLCAKPH